MKKIIVIAGVVILALAGLAMQAKPAPGRKVCEDLKAEIAAKLDAKGVKKYTLDIVDADKTGDRKVVGSCDGGTMKIVYTRK